MWGLTCLSWGHCSWFNVNKETGQKWHWWESSQANWDQKEHEGLSHICLKRIDYPIDFWANIQWTDVLEGVHPITSVIQLTQHFRNRTSDQQSVAVMVWGSFADSGPGRLWLTAVIDGTMNSLLFKKLLRENVWSSFHGLKLKHS